MSAFGACTSITLRMYAERKGWTWRPLRVDLAIVRDAAGEERITRTLRFAAGLTDEQQAKLAEIAEKTPVTKTIKRGTSIQTRIGAPL
jgi:putative redox protein